MSFKAGVSSLIFCLDDLSSVISEVSKVPTFIVTVNFSLMLVNTCFMYFGAMLDAYLYITVISSR